jgi:hypothetical protein
MSDAELTIDGLASRVERLEAFTGGLRWLVAALVVAIGIALVFFLVAQQSQISNKSVRAESFFLRNAAGNNIAVLGSDADGMPSLALLDAQKKVRLLIYLQHDGLPGLSLLDPQSQTRATLSLNNDQDPSLVLFDAQKDLRAIFGLDTNSAAITRLLSSKGSLNLFGSNGSVQWNAAGGAAKDVPVQK